MDFKFGDNMILDPKNDVVFQKIFGSPENEDILISFLNALLEGTEKEKIRHIEYVDTKLSDIESVDDKIGILDVRVVTEKGIHINVEIQLINKYNMANRTLFYWSRLYSSQIKRGENYRILNKTITINILNFNYIESNKYHTVYHLYEDDEKIMLTDILEIHFVELPKFLQQEPELNNTLNKWLAFLATPEKEMIGGIDMAEPAIRKAITVLDMLSRDPETVRLAELRMKQLLDEKSMIEGAKEEGKIEGLEEGIEIGEDKRAVKIAIKMLKRGDTIKDIIDVTELSEERIAELKKDI